LFKPIYHMHVRVALAFEIKRWMYEVWVDVEKLNIVTNINKRMGYLKKKTKRAFSLRTGSYVLGSNPNTSATSISQSLVWAHWFRSLGIPTAEKVEVRCPKGRYHSDICILSECHCMHT
jgi:hypothetical protein